jgi:cold shock CspA family protein
MGLNFGHVKEYISERGFGFVSSDFDIIRSNYISEVFFHISKISAVSPKLREEIESRGRVGNKNYVDIRFWYETEISSDQRGKNKLKVGQIWLTKDDIPLEKRDQLILRIKKRWFDTQNSIPLKLEQFTLDFFGEVCVDELNQERAKILDVCRVERKLKEAEITEEKRRKEISDLVEKEKQQKEVDEYRSKINKIVQDASEEEIAVFLQSANRLEINDVWSNPKLINRLKYKGLLWNLADLGLKHKIVVSHFSFLSDLDKLEKEIEIYSHADKVKIDAKKIYDNLDDRDRELAQYWSGKENEHELAKMLSARSGEKFVAKCYSNLGYVVKDISIQQLQDQNSEWQNHDLLLNNKIAIDVKNARRKDSAGDGKYSEFCVPKFKANRSDEVIIAGVLSPYLRLEDIDNTSKGDRRLDPIIFLGEINASTIDDLETIFLGGTLKSIKMPRKSSSKVTVKYIPPWLFDYPNLFYRNQIEIISSMVGKDWEESEIPDWEDMQYLKKPRKYIKLFLFAGLRPPEIWTSHLRSWEKELINKLLISHSRKGRITLPYLFMSLLSHFLDMLSIDCEEYHPNQYYSLLLSSLSTDDFSQVTTNWYFPGIYDPLQTIPNLCNTLATLWDNRVEMQIKNFSYFQFNGRGILKGKRSSKEYDMTTLLAYCGGWKGSTGGACGFAPLLQKKHDTCDVCKWLKCPKCGHCRCQEQAKSLSPITS